MIVEAMRAFEGIRKGARFEVDPKSDRDVRLMAFVRQGILRPVVLDDGDQEALDAPVEETKPKRRRATKVAVPVASPVQAETAEVVTVDDFVEHDN